MNRRLKLLILLLFAAVIFLSIGIASLRMSDGSEGQTESEAVPAANGSAIQLYQEKESGRWGARTANGRELIAPTWAFLRPMSDTVLIARRDDSKAVRIGLISAAGEILVPFLYQSMDPADKQDTNVWLAAFQEGGKTCYHIYRADGTRWMNETWDSCVYQDGILDVAKGANRYQCRLTHAGIEWLARYEEYPVGLHKLVMDLDSRELERLPDGQTLTGLGESAAYYLRYLFAMGTEPDNTMLDTENAAALRAAPHYRGCRLQTAEISRIKQLKTDGLPSYLMQMQVTYQRTDAERGQEKIRTAMTLTVSCDADGAYMYSSFSDAQRIAAGGGS